MTTGARPLSGRVALVTGAGQRLGQAIALGLGRLGADVALHCNTSADGARAAAEALRVDGNRAEVVRADLLDVAACQGLVAAAQAALGPISVLVNSAALYVREDFEDTSLETLERQWHLNVRAPFLVTQAFARAVRAQAGTGDVVNVLDIGGTANVWRHYSAYTMTKAALASLTQSLALELAPAVRVNGVAPGTVMPPESLPDEVATALRQRIPQQRFGSPDDIVQTVAFLVAGPAFITGQIIAADGGRSLAGA